MEEWLGENVIHHGLLEAKKKKNWLKSSKTIPKKWNLDQKINDTKPLIWSCLSINFRFSGRFSKPTKTINKDLSHNNYSFCWPSGLGNYFVCKRLFKPSCGHWNL